MATAQAQVVPADQAAELARAQAVASIQAAAQAVSGANQFEQALAKAAQELALRAAQEAAAAPPDEPPGLRAHPKDCASARERRTHTSD